MVPGGNEVVIQAGGLQANLNGLQFTFKVDEKGCLFFSPVDGSPAATSVDNGQLAPGHVSASEGSSGAEATPTTTAVPESASDKDSSLSNDDQIDRKQKKLLSVCALPVD